MSVRSKVAGAAMTVAAPEAKVAAKAAGAGRKITPDMSPDEVKAETQRRKDVRAAGGDPFAHEHQDDEHQDDEHQDDEHQDDDGGAGGKFAPFAGMQGPATGGGFLLGLIGWAVFRAYLGVNDAHGHPVTGADGKALTGWAGVKALGAAKFLNRTPTTSGGSK